ncbi:lipopolysaccharide biosynthesis protein [Leeuwenhoekiella nanhaiensis]|uniref:Polysaccharide biosynthesis protein n=1 Tax=Leeuwenhoekiella nanhaiensis TaxID=1655491 RepID=A0A2G1VNF1_9FLAO|nr:hypothetical protein [Leeuwenhoekiella nanhaiensis]PHQ28286.1 hypothetical protein CJ305_15735 [Leeuwenhoekiella nanhaiensis]
MTSLAKTKMIGGVVFLQLTSFLITFGTSIIIIRELTKEDYAIFTVCFQILGMVAVMTSSGITPTFKRLSGSFWDRSSFFSSIVASLLYLRNKLLFVVVPVSLIIATILIVRQTGFAFEVILWIFLLGVLVIIEVKRSMYLEILRSQMQIGKVQLSENLLNACKLIFGLIILIINQVEVLLASYILASILALFYTRSKALKHYDPKTESRYLYTNLMFKKYKELLPNSIYYIIQSQLILFLLVFFQNSDGVADYGAIGKISIVFNVFNVVILNVFATEFSRKREINKLRKTYLNIIAVSMLVCVFTYFVVFLLQSFILDIFGEKYQGLEKLLMVLTATSCVTFLFSTIGMLNNAKAWVRYNSKFAIPLSTAAIILGVILLDFSNIYHIVLFSIFPVVSTGFLKIADSLKGLKILKL